MIPVEAAEIGKAIVAVGPRNGIRFQEFFTANVQASKRAIDVK